VPATGCPISRVFCEKACPERSRRMGIFSPQKKRPDYFFRRRRTGFRKTSHASRYFSYFDRFFRLAG
jgi:hypothetical protein